MHPNEATALLSRISESILHDITTTHHNTINLLADLTNDYNLHHLTRGLKTIAALQLSPTKINSPPCYIWRLDNDQAHDNLPYNQLNPYTATCTPIITPHQETFWLAEKLTTYYAVPHPTLTHALLAAATALSTEN